MWARMNSTVPVWCKYSGNNKLEGSRFQLSCPWDWMLRYRLPDSLWLWVSVCLLPAPLSAEVLYGFQYCSGDVLNSFHHPLWCLLADGGAFALPGCDADSQDALNCAWNPGWVCTAWGERRTVVLLFLWWCLHGWSRSSLMWTLRNLKLPTLSTLWGKGQGSGLCPFLMLSVVRNQLILFCQHWDGVGGGCCSECEVSDLLSLCSFNIVCD